MMHDFFPMFITQVWQVTLLAVVVWIVTKTFCKRRPHLGHALWLLVLIKCVVPPVFSSSTSVYSWMLMHDNPRADVRRSVDAVPAVAVAESPNVIARSEVIVAHTPTDEVRRQPIQTNFEPPAVPNVAFKPTRSVVPPNPDRQPVSSFQETGFAASPPVVSASVVMQATPRNMLSPTAIRHAWILKIWLCGAALFLTVTLLRYMRFKFWIRRRKTVEAGDVESQVQALAKRLKLRRKIRVKVVDAEFGPAVIGLFRPTIVLPNSIVADQTAEQLEPILGHELLHLRRGDIYWSVLQVVACSLMWFHPLVWLASRNVTRESEKCCDEETIANFQCDRANYARVLVDILEQKSRLRIAPVVPGVRPADITSSRLERIMETDNGTCRRTPRWIWVLAFLIAITVLPGAAMVQSQESDVAETTIDSTFQTEDPRWRLSGAGNQELLARGVPKSAMPEAYRKEVKRRLQRGNSVSPPTAQAQRVETSNAFRSSDFNPGAAKARFEAKVIEMTKDDEEQKKILSELKDIAWKSSEARARLLNCKNPEVDLEIRVAKLPNSTAEGTEIGGKDQSERQIPKAELKKLLDHVATIEGAEISPVTTQSFYASKSIRRSVSAYIQRPVVYGVRAFSILNPANLKPNMREQQEGVTCMFTVKEVKDDVLSLDSQLVFQYLKVSAGRKLPLRLGSKDFRIENAVANRYELSNELNIPEDKAQVIFGNTGADAKSKMMVIVEASISPSLVCKAKDLTLEDVLKIKEELPKEPALATRTDDVRVVPTVSSGNTGEKTESTLSVSESNPVSLLLQCGKVDQEKSLNTKIGLAGKGSLTIEGEVESQQISADSVQVSGMNFVFKNEASEFRRYEADADGEANVLFDSEKARKAGLFSAKAGNGSISFNRGLPIENTMRLSLRSKAVLQFAGIEFSAESIECFPGRIEANGNVKVSIPEITSKVSAGRVVMNLESLAFDFDGDVKVERNIGEDSFPFLVKGNHVGWRLVTGEMQTDKRYSNQRQAVRNSNRPFNQIQRGYRGTVQQPQSANGFSTPQQTFPPVSRNPMPSSSPFATLPSRK